MSARDLLQVGRVARPHGLRGECKVIPECDKPAHLLDLQEIWLGSTPDASRPVRIDTARLQHSRRGVIALMRLDGAQSREEAARYVHLNVYACEKDLPPLEPGEFFLHELVGMTVVTAGGTSIGAVKDVWEMPANNLYVVERPGKKDALIPAVPAFVRKVDRKNREMLVTPVEGLLD